MAVEFPRKLDFLLPGPGFKPSRYKVLYGGRGGLKSWSFARAALLHGSQRKLKILCARETQKSIADSVHALLKEQISALDLDGSYRVEKAKIYGPNGTEFLFFGLKHNVADIKSCEGVDLVWIEEAEAVSKSSWDTLIPTIRKENSEIWISYNPQLETDETHQRFAIKEQPDSIVLKLTWRDNPWFPEVLRKEMEYCRVTRPDDYQHIWEGCCVSMLEGAIYVHELRKVDAENRITKVPYDQTKPVHTFWDLGVDDSTAIWFVQQIGFEFHAIDYLEGTGKGLPVYLKELQQKQYIYGTHYLPHDGRAREFGTGKSSEEIMRQAGMRVLIVPRLSVADGINAARTIFDRCFFDAEKCADGLQALRHYRYGEREELGVKTKEPLHDWASHGADAWRYFAVGIKPPKAKPPQPHRPARPLSAWS